MGNRASKRRKSKSKEQDDDQKEKPKEVSETPPLADPATALDAKWREFYMSAISKFHRNRAKFVFLGALAKSYTVQSIENKQFGYWYHDEKDGNQPKCDSVYADFSIRFNLKYNTKSIKLKLSAMFDNKKYALFDDNFASKDWTIKLILLDQNVKKLWFKVFEATQNPIFENPLFSETNKRDIIPIVYDYLYYSKTTFIDDVYLYKNGEVDETHCELLDAYISAEDGMHVSEYFDILLQWFLSLDATEYRKTYVKTEMIWQN